MYGTARVKTRHVNDLSFDYYWTVLQRPLTQLSVLDGLAEVNTFKFIFFGM